jgi:hypothetical protein
MPGLRWHGSLPVSPPGELAGNACLATETRWPASPLRLPVFTGGGGRRKWVGRSAEVGTRFSGYGRGGFTVCVGSVCVVLVAWWIMSSGNQRRSHTWKARRSRLPQPANVTLQVPDSTASARTSLASLTWLGTTLYGKRPGYARPSRSRGP